jgi:hypothetical protein
MNPTAAPSPALARKKLPIGIQTFREIREDNCYYVDKTGMAVDLVQTGKAYFLSRPRRFGKSLFLDTLKELFEGNRALFTGLAADPLWDWGKTHPVIRISFGAGVVQSRADLDDVLDGQLLSMELRCGLSQSDLSIRRRFSHLIEQLHAQTGERVVVLVDEYDKPILDNIDNRAMALEVREGLKDFYSVIKDSDAHVRFALLTGVSKFSKVSLFSGLNNLTDITMDARYSALCGYTETDVDTVFAAELPGLNRQQIRDWYNGYNWLGTPVYNPFDLLLLFRSHDFRPYWFETGTPTFLVKLLTERLFFTPNLSRLHASESLLSAFDVEAISTEALLWQTGYLTLAGERKIGARTIYALGYPNLEVRSGLNDALLKGLMGDASLAEQVQGRLFDALSALDFVALKVHFQSLYSAIAHQWFTNNPITQYEGYYASVFYSHFAALGLDIRLEDPTNVGRIDMTVLFVGQVFLFEFKVVEMNPNGSALQQLKDMAYADKYRSRGEPIHLIGVEFSKASRNIVGFGVETLSAQ